MIRISKAVRIVLAIVAFSAYALAVGKPSADVEPLVTIREAPEHVVLYTLYRGPYDGVGAAIGRLYALLGSKGLTPKGSLSFSYLNNPDRWAKEHWLTEISVPVDREALKLTGTLGDFTDVKVVSAATLVVAAKPAGMADPSVIYRALIVWVAEHDVYEPLEGPCEVFPASVSGSYESMQTEIMIPVTRQPEPEGKQDS